MSTAVCSLKMSLVRLLQSDVVLGIPSAVKYEINCVGLLVHQTLNAKFHNHTGKAAATSTRHLAESIKSWQPMAYQLEGVANDMCRCIYVCSIINSIYIYIYIFASNN